MKKLIFLFLATLLLTNCSKDDSNDDPLLRLPPETQTGANTFGCLINGTLLIPRNGSNMFGGANRGMILWGSPIGTEYNELEVNDYKSSNGASLLLHIHSLDLLGAANYIINESNGQSSIDGLNHTYLHCRVFDKASNTYKNYRSFTNSGLLRVTRFDFIPSVIRIVSGTFTCKVRNANNPADEIEITSGRFDINGRTLRSTIFP